MGIFDFLPTLAEMNAKPRSMPKGPTRLEEKTAHAKDDKKAEKAFLKAVHKRDGKVCRCCKREVVATLEVIEAQRQVHHIYGRIGEFRYDPNHALVLCRACHERVTGAVGKARLFLVQTASRMLKVDGKPSRIDARKKVEFKEAA